MTLRSGRALTRPPCKSREIGMSDLPETADVVIVGGGSAGAVLAARLSQDPARTVLLLEAGPAYAPGAFPPALLDARILDDPRHDWGYTARATDQAPNIRASRGKVLGGSSAVNAGVAIRPRPADFAKWGAHGADGWSFADVLPTFKLMENNPGGEDAYHGRTGPLPVRQLTDEELTPSQAGFIGAAVAHGFKRVRDFNGADQDGVSGHSVNVVNGIRENAAIVFLTAEVRRRPNLTIRGDVTIDRVLFDGTAATGVVAADGTVYRAGEVILSAGSYGSPAILLRSGVGPADDLTALGIGVVADIPVGRAAAGSPVLSHRPRAGSRAPGDDPSGRRDPVGGLQRGRARRAGPEHHGNPPDSPLLQSHWRSDRAVRLGGPARVHRDA